MKKYILIAGLLSGFSMQAFCQSNDAFKTDSIRLINLKKILPTLKGTSRVDLLNSIGLKTLFNAGGSQKNRVDTSLFYASKAYNEAVKLGYKTGMALALVQLSGTESYMNLPTKDEEKKEKNLREAIRLAEESNDNEVLGWAYYYLAGLPSISKDFNTYLNYYKRSINYFLNAGDTLHAAELTNWLVGNYQSRGEYEQAFDYAKKSIELSKKSGTDFSMNWQQFLVQFSLSSMYDLYTAAGDYEGARHYLNEMDSYGKSHKGADWDIILGTADLFCKMGKYDSALAYINRWIMDGAAINSGKGHQAVGWYILGKIYLDSTKEYSKAIEIFKNWSDTIKKFHPLGTYATTQFLISIGQAYDGRKYYDSALHYAKQGVHFAQEKNQRPEMMQGYQLLSAVYHHLGNNDSAYTYLVKYNTLKDSIQTKQFLLRIYNAKKDAEVEKDQAKLLLLDKDNKLMAQQIKQQAQQKKLLLVILAALSLTGILVYRAIALKRKNERLRLENALTVQRLESEKKHAELKRQAADLRMQALRAQMNPHFIFNSLSSINWYILENNKDAASDYLTRFSRLMRMVLNAQKPMIPLEDELKMLQLYLDMERLRFENAFDYSITFTNSIDAGTISIPPMLLQPFCENSIWHGFMNKEEQGHININIRTENHLLECTITDNGIGRKQAAAFKIKSAKKEKSMGLEITRQRLALFNEENNADAYFEVADLEDENGICKGTRVILRIAYKEFIEKVA